MTGKSFNLRGVPEDLMEILKEKAREKEKSVNAVILNIIMKSTGYQVSKRKKTFHDLDHLAGTWSKNEGNEFLKNTHDFEQIDEDIWK